MVQYEKISMFCFHCGLMGHEVTECGDGIHEINKCPWGGWLRVSFLPILGGREDTRRGRGRGGGRRGGRGRGQIANSEDDYEEMDTSNGEEEQDGGLSSRKREVTYGDGKGLVAQHVKLLENTIPNAITTSPQKE